MSRVNFERARAVVLRILFLLAAALASSYLVHDYPIQHLEVIYEDY